MNEWGYERGLKRPERRQALYGIERADFTVETAKLSLWIGQMNRDSKNLFGQTRAEEVPS
jgi:hypothetical protein